jgi:hypothetical protein
MHLASLELLGWRLVVGVCQLGGFLDDAAVLLAPVVRAIWVNRCSAAAAHCVTAQPRVTSSE